MVRVLQVIGSLNTGGSQAMIMNLYRSIDRSKVQFDFVIFHNDERMHEEEITKLGGKVYYIPAFNGRNLFSFIQTWKSFFKEHPEYKIVHGHVRSVASIYLYIAKRMGRVTIAHSHSTSNGEGVSALVKNIMQFPIRYTTEYMFACSERAGEWLFGSKAIKKDNFKVVANGIDLERFEFDETIRKQTREQLGISEDTVVIGHVGRFTEPKNHKFLIDIFSEFQNKVPNSKLLLVGDGELMTAIKEKVSEKNIQEKVIFVGNRSNTEAFYQVMDVFVFPSLWEGLGIVAIEAIANGLAVIASENVPREIALSERVFFLSLNSVDKWVKYLVDNCYRVDNVSDNKKLQTYDIKQIADGIQEFYLRVVE